MLFNSFNFVIFLPTVLVLYYLFPQKRKWLVLLGASYLFYMAWNPVFIILLLFSTFVNYIMSINIANKRKPKLCLIIALLVSFSLLFVFKYAVFINESIGYLLDFMNIPYQMPEFSILLPMGISFFTFQAVAYTIDTYRGEIVPERNFFKFSLFISFFPQLVAGPIERSENLFPQLFKKHTFQVDNLLIGGKWMILGFFKKVVIADRIAVAVNTVYNQPLYSQGLAFIIATVLFAFQLYCDFCGYSEIALGCAKMMDIDLMENFRNPYLSKNIKTFWRRWHISLSTWFKDYLYIPLGGNRVSTVRRYGNLLVTFVVSGLWHGANWTFLLWGFIHGVYQIIGDIVQTIRDKLSRFIPLVKYVRFPGFLQVIICFGLVCFALIFFRANTVEDAFYIIAHLKTGLRGVRNPQYIYNVVHSLGLELFDLLVGIIAIAFLFLSEFVSELVSNGKNIYYTLERGPLLVRFLYYFLLASAILTLGVFYNAGEFIYFQF